MIPTQTPIRRDCDGPMDHWREKYHIERDVGAPDNEPLGELLPCEHGTIWVNTVDPPVLGLTVDKKTFLQEKEFKRLVGMGAIEMLGDDGGSYDALIKGQDEEVFFVMGAYTHEEAKDEFDIQG